MPYCPSCGVELAASATKCPLCGALAVDHLPQAERIARALASHETVMAQPESGLRPAVNEGRRRGDAPAEDEGSIRERDTIRWEMLSVSALISAIAVCAVNFISSGRLTWALYPLFSLAFVWVNLTALIKLRRLPFVGWLVTFVSLPTYLLGLNLVEGHTDWALPLGIPITVIVELSFGAALFASAALKWRPLLVLALCMTAATISSLGIDGAVWYALHGTIAFHWSGIVAAALVPVAGFVAYVHFRVLKIARFKRLFRF